MWEVVCPFGSWLVDPIIIRRKCCFKFLFAFVCVVLPFRGGMSWQVICQMDIGWAMDLKKGMTWMTFPRSNFGLFMVKAHPISVRIFARAWQRYLAMPEKNKKVVAKDQSIIHEVMRVHRRIAGYNYSYFFPGFLPSTMDAPIIYKSALLLHKVEDYNDHGVRFELGKSLQGVVWEWV